MADKVSTRLTLRDYRRFGLSVGGVFVLLAVVELFRHRATGATVFGTLGTVLVVGGLAAPSLLAPVYKIWMGFAKAMSRVTTPVFMTGIYTLVLTPTGWVMRMVGRRPLKPVAGPTGYWVVREQRQADLQRQF